PTESWALFRSRCMSAAAGVPSLRPRGQQVTPPGKSLPAARRGGRLGGGNGNRQSARSGANRLGTACIGNRRRVADSPVGLNRSAVEVRPLSWRGRVFRSGAHVF